jgi:hypothetical protein
MINSKVMSLDFIEKIDGFKEKDKAGQSCQ